VRGAAECLLRRRDEKNVCSSKTIKDDSEEKVATRFIIKASVVVALWLRAEETEEAERANSRSTNIKAARLPHLTTFNYICINKHHYLWADLSRFQRGRRRANRAESAQSLFNALFVFRSFPSSARSGSAIAGNLGYYVVRWRRQLIAHQTA
jgi:hypothetical protein